MFSMKRDVATCYELKIKILATKQGSLLIIDYYGILNGLWIELDQYQNLKMEYGKDVAMLTSFVERNWILEFLLGLNPKYDPIRVLILGKEKLPSLFEGFYTVHRGESCQVVMLDEKPIDRSTLATSKKSKLSSLSLSSKPNRDGHWCTFAKHMGIPRIIFSNSMGRTMFSITLEGSRAFNITKAIKPFQILQMTPY